MVTVGILCQYRVLENYDLGKIVQALIKKLENAGVLDSGAMIIEKGIPERSSLQ